MQLIVVRPSARRDQLTLAEYYDAESSEALGDRFLSECDAGMERLCRFPESGAVVAHRHSKLYGCRMIPVPGFEKILIFFEGTAPNGLASARQDGRVPRWLEPCLRGLCAFVANRGLIDPLAADFLSGVGNLAR